MIVLLQRVSRSAVSVSGQTIAQVNQGILALIGFERGDGNTELERMGQRLLNYRIFSDDESKMNLNVQQVGGGILLVPQFTLAADTNRGNRPSFSIAAAPDDGRRLFQQFAAQIQQQHADTACGEFGADMQVSLINDGPVTFWLQVQPKGPLI